MLTEKKPPEAKAVIQTSSCDNCVCYYSNEILKRFDPGF